LIRFSRKLERVGRAYEGYVEYAGRTRNFAEYAFHMVYMLKELGTVGGSLGGSGE
jgi:hypothetical protein